MKHMDGFRTWVRLFCFVMIASLGCSTAIAQTATLAVPNVTVAEGNGPNVVDVSISLDQPATSDVTFDYFTVDGSAAAGTDFVEIASTPGVIPAGSQQLNVPITILGNTLSEPDKQFAVQVININNAAPASTFGTVTLSNDDQPLALSPAAGALNAPYGAAYSQTFAASGGTGNFTYAYTGALPAGLTFSGDSLSGTPTAPGVYNFTITATDASSTGPGAPYSVAQNYSLEVLAPTVTVTPTTLANPTAGVAYSQTLTATGGVPGYSFSLSTGALPAGINLSSTGTLSGTPTAVGNYIFTVTATDANAQSGSRAYSVTVAPPTLTLSPAPGALPAGNFNVAYSQTLATSGGTPAYSYAITSGAVPTGLTLSATGVLSGTPAAAGTFNFAVTSTDSTTGTGAPYSVTSAYTLTVTAPTIDIQPPTLPAAMAGVAYSQALTASGGTGGYAFSITAGALPAGVVLSAGGVLSGTPTVNGSFSFTVQASDSSPGGPFTGSRSYTLVVGAPTIVLAPGVLPAIQVAVPYAETITASGGTGPYTFLVTSGALPAGVTLTPQGLLDGTPTAAGSYNFTVQATDAFAQTGSQAYTVQVAAPGLVLSPAAGTLSATYGNAYTQTFTANGGIGPYSYTIISGALPAGLVLNGSQISGTPTAPGTYNFVLRTTDAGSSGPGAPFLLDTPFVLQVASPTISVDPAALPAGAVGAPWVQQLSATGGTAPYQYAISSGALPAGLALSATGAFSGTPTTAGTSTFTVTATDTNGQAGQRSYTVQISDAVPVAVDDTATALAGADAPLAVTSNDAGVITSINVVQLPQHGVATVAGLVVSYIAQAGYSGQDSLQYTVTGPGGTSAPATVNITVNPVPVAVSSTVVAAVDGETRVDLTQGATGGPFTGATLVSLAPSTAGTASIGAGTAGGYELRFRPADGYSGDAVATFTLSNAFATSAAATVRLQVQARPDPTLDADVRGLANAQLESARRFAHTQIDNFQSRLERLHGNGQRGGRLDNQLTFATREQCDTRNSGRTIQDCLRAESALALPADAAGQATHGSTAAASSAPSSGAWISGNLRSGGYNGIASTSSVGFETSGISAGYDADVAPDVTLGGGVGYGRDTSDVGFAGSRSKAEAFSVVGYASYHPGAFFIDALVGYQSLRYDLRRHVMQVDGFVDADRDGNQWFGSLSVGADVAMGTAQLTPYVRFDVARGDLDAYQESGSDVWSLAYGQTDVGSTRGSAGVRFDFRREFDWGAVTPLLRVEYQRELEGNDVFAIRYADTASGPFYSLRPINYDRSRFVLGIGATLNWNSGWATRLEYRADAGSTDQHENSYLLNLQKDF